MVWQPVRSTEKSNELVYKVLTIHSKHLINTSHGHIINYNVIELWSDIQYYAWLNRLHKEILVSRCWLPHLYITQCSISCMWEDRFTHKPVAPGCAVLKGSSSLSPPFSVFSETFHSQFSLWPSRHQWSLSLLYFYPASLLKGNKSLLTGSGLSSFLRIATGT